MLNYQCLGCKERLSFIAYNRSPYCEKPACQRAKVKHYLSENKKRLTAQIVAECEEYLQHLATKKAPSALAEKSTKSTPIVALLPANVQQLTRLSTKRKRKFLTHLSTIYHDIENNRPTANKVYAEQPNQPAPEGEAKLLGQACATCKGACCKHGKTHAFIDYPSLKYMLIKQNKELTEEAVLALYAEHFPKQSFADACVFQGEKGCTLPRQLRSFTCNNYLCEELTDYRKSIQKTDSRITYAAAIEKNQIIFSSVITDDCFIRVRDNVTS